MRIITKEDFGMWKLNPVTQEFFKNILELRENGLEELALGLHSTDIGKTHLVIGKVNALTNVLNISFEEEEKPNDGADEDGGIYGS